MALSDYIPFFDRIKKKDRSKPLIDLAEIISLVLDPFGTTLLTSLFVVYKLNIAFTNQKVLILALLLISLAVPATYFLYELKTGRIKDIFISDRTERYRLLLITCLVATVFNGILWYYKAPPLILAYSLSALALIAIITAITFFWKISGHTSVLTLNILTVVTILGPDYVWLGLLVPVVGWARVTLKVHTLEQAVAGALASGVIFYFVFSQLGLIQF